MSNYEFNKSKPIRIPNRGNSINHGYGYEHHRSRLKSESYNQDSSFSLMFNSSHLANNWFKILKYFLALHFFFCKIFYLIFFILLLLKI